MSSHKQHPQQTYSCVRCPFKTESREEAEAHFRELQHPYLPSNVEAEIESLSDVLGPVLEEIHAERPRSFDEALNCATCGGSGDGIEPGPSGADALVSCRDCGGKGFVRTFYGKVMHCLRLAEQLEQATADVLEDPSVLVLGNRSGEQLAILKANAALRVKDYAEIAAETEIKTKVVAHA